MKKSIVLVAAMVLATIVNPGNSLTAAARQEGSALNVTSADQNVVFSGTWKGLAAESIGRENDPIGAGTMSVTLVGYESGSVRGVWSAVDEYGEFRSGTVTGTVRGAAMTVEFVNSASGIRMPGQATFAGAKLSGSFAGVFPNPERDRVTGNFVLVKR